VSAALVVPPLLLAAVLTLSWAAKVGAVDETADAIVSLRLPHALLDLRVPRLLPWGELALAALLVLTPQPVYAAAAALVVCLTAAYLAVVVRAVRFQEPATCACFGRLGLATVGPVTVVRNAVLLAVALLTLADAVTDEGVPARLAGLDGSALAWLAMAALCVLVGALVVWGGRESAGPGPVAAAGGAGGEAADVRAPIPFAALTTSHGAVVTLRQLAAARPRLLLFLSPACGACLRVLDRVPAFVEATPELATHPVVGSPVAAQSLPDGLDVLLDEDRSVRDVFAVGTPAAVLLGADGLLAAGPAVGFHDVAELMDQIADQLAARRTAE
jgi:hypothetical protein